LQRQPELDLLECLQAYVAARGRGGRASVRDARGDSC
jgi:hypothetical protein